jgi:hypothetical protein
MVDWAQTFQSTLGRAPTQSDLSYWQNAGPNAAADFNFAAQQELGGRAKSVDFGSLYKNTLGREGTADELNFWKGSTFTDPSTSFFDAAQKELAKRPDATPNNMFLAGGLSNPNFWGMTRAEQQANAGRAGNALASGTLPADFGSSGFGSFGGGTGAGAGAAAAPSWDVAGAYKNIGRDPSAEELKFWQQYKGPNPMGAFNAAASSEIGGRSAALAKQQQEQQQRMAQEQQQQQRAFQDQQRAFQEQQQRMMQDQQMQMMQEWSRMAGFNRPTFGPGSGSFGNFGGNTSPVYRPDDPTAGPRNGFGGPWASSNPWTPTF